MYIRTFLCICLRMIYIRIIICFNCLYIYLYFVGIITTPPENTTVCRGSDVTISCGYQSLVALAVRWMINDDVLTENEIMMNSDDFELNNPSMPNATSLTVLSIRVTTTIQCVIPFRSEVFSWVGTVTVIGE